MAAKADKRKTLELGEIAIFEVAVSHYGLEKGLTREMTVTPELLQCIEEGLWKLKK